MAQLSLSTVVVLLTFGFFLGLLYGTASSRTEVRPVAVVSASDKMYAERFTKATKATADGPFLLIGVISSPTAFGRRRILRKFATASASPTRPVQTEFVFGNSLYSGDMPADDQQRLADEANAHGDAIFVNARERMPHVGKAAEKSAGWWLTAPKRSGASFFCKTDDDSLIHHEHLTAALAAAAKDAKSPNIIFSYIRWRGWLPGNRFQACGGGWGGPIDAIRHIEDPSTHCELAEGPFPQGTGQLTCLSRPLALALANSVEFDSFQRIAMARNDFGTPCSTADECAKHKFAVHMWHHEDAGISYNVWRAANALKINVSLVHMPEKGWIWPWFSPKIADARQSARAILMHKVTPQNYKEVSSAWKTSLRAPADLMVDCSQTCTTWGWKYARKQCAPPPPLSVARAGPGGWRGFGVAWNGSQLCHVDPVKELGWRCCFLRTGDDK